MLHLAAHKVTAGLLKVKAGGIKLIYNFLVMIFVAAFLLNPVGYRMPPWHDCTAIHTIPKDVNLFTNT